jgi:hypothetical protein
VNRDRIEQDRKRENEKEKWRKDKKKKRNSYFLFSLSSSVSSERRTNCEKCRKQTNNKIVSKFEFPVKKALEKLFKNNNSDPTMSKRK